QGKIKQADESGGGEAPAPAKMQQQNAKERHSDSGRELCRGIRDGRGQTSFLVRKPVAERFGVAGKSGGLGDAEKKPGSDKADQSRGQSGAERGRAPEKGPDPPDTAHSHPAKQDPRRHRQ